MRIIIAGNQDNWMELVNGSGLPWLHWEEDVSLSSDDVLLDLRDEAWDMEWYARAGNNPVFVSATMGTLADHHAPGNIIRMNSWLGTGQQAIECAADHQVHEQAEQVMLKLGMRIEWVPDVPGMVSGRVIAMIINEAWMTLEEGVSSRHDIDIAMKLGTNYPYGPFEWCDKIGAARVAALLKLLAEQNKRYDPSPSLLQYAVDHKQAGQVG